MKTTFTASVLVLTTAALASAQTYAVPSATGSYGYGLGDYSYHASTLEEGVLRGRAALAVGVGQGNYYNSLANINNQEAYSRSIQNHQKSIEAYFYNKQANHAAREAQRSPRLTTEQYIALAKKEAPARLTEQQYDRTFARLSWPTALEGDAFAAERQQLDAAFGGRSPGDAGASTEFYVAVRQLTQSLETKLKTQIDTLDSAQYMTARKFLVSLSHEATQPAIPRTLAAK